VEYDGDEKENATANMVRGNSDDVEEGFVQGVAGPDEGEGGAIHDL